MKKFIQICSVFGLLVLFGAISANAQSNLGSEINIPFAFHVGDRSYDAGSYILKIERLQPGTATLAMRDTKSDEVQVVILNGNGESPAKELKLVFDTIDGQRYLTRVRTTERTYGLLKSKAEKDAAKVRDEKESGAAAAGTSNIN